MHKAPLVLFAVALALIVIGTGSPYWGISSTVLGDSNEGLWKSCTGSDCTTSDNDPNTCNDASNFPTDKSKRACQELYAAKGFAILTILFLVLSAICDWAGKDGGWKIKLAYLFAFVSVGCGLIASAAYGDRISYYKDQCGGFCTVKYGWAFGLFTAGWMLEVLAILVWCVKGNNSA